GVTWRNYGTKLYDPFLSIDRYATDTEHNADELRFFDDVIAGMLPSVVWVRPSAPESEHPGYDISQGEQWTVGVVNAIMRSSYWSSTAILLTWDDAGDVVDHVPPPVVEREGSGVPIRYGHRVALIVISPYTPAGTVSQVLLSHVSLLRFIEDVFQVRSLTFRDQTANGLSEFFDFTRAARPPEILRQVDLFIEILGRPPDHLDSHQHVHLGGVAREASIEAARRLDVPLRGVGRNVTVCGGFYGQQRDFGPYLEGVSFENLLRLLDGMPAGWNELTCHPG